MASALQQEYDENGYVIVRKAIDADLAREAAEHVHWLAERNPGVRPEKFGHGMLVADPFMQPPGRRRPPGRYCRAIHWAQTSPCGRRIILPNHQSTAKGSSGIRTAATGPWSLWK